MNYNLFLILCFIMTLCIVFLVYLNESLRKRIKELISAVHYSAEWAKLLFNEKDKKIERLKKALEFYADTSNFGDTHCGDPSGNDRGFLIYEDEGKVARQALKEVENERFN